MYNKTILGKKRRVFPALIYSRRIYIEKSIHVRTAIKARSGTRDVDKTDIVFIGYERVSVCMCVCVCGLGGEGGGK